MAAKKTRQVRVAKPKADANTSIQMRLSFADQALALVEAMYAAGYPRAVKKRRGRKPGKKVSRPRKPRATAPAPAAADKPKRSRAAKPATTQATPPMPTPAPAPVAPPADHGPF
jgi:hypothetical protein